MNPKKILSKEILILCIIGLILTINPVYGITDVQSDFNKLTSDVSALPSGTVPGNSFMAKIGAAQAAIDSNKSCTAINILGALRNEISAKAGKKGFTSIMANQIDTDVIAIIALLMETPDTAKCGGGTASSSKNSPETTIISSDANGIKLHISFPEAHFISRIGNGNPFTDVSMDGMGYLKDIGKPDIPSLTQLFAIPIGADVSVQELDSTSYKIDNIKLWPKQEEPVDDTFGNRPFKIDTQFYATNAFYPTDPTKTGPLGTMRDLNIGGIETDGAQYNAVAKSLNVYTGITLQITFGGGNTGKFGDSRMTSIWNQPFNGIYQTSLLNFNTTKSQIIFTEIYQFCGKDDLIITSHELRPAADTLANARMKDGLWVDIVEVGKGPGQIGDTPEEIRKYIQDQIVNNICINRPSYVTIIGNTVNVPTFHVNDPLDGDPESLGFDGVIASDLPYALPICTTQLCRLVQNIFPNVIIGRIPAGDLRTANIEVNKIVRYEDHPPQNFAFYSKATFTSYFQGPGPIDDRGFTKTSETIRSALTDLHYEVDRIYTDDADTVDPQAYYDGRPIPAELKKPGFVWRTDGKVDLINHWNDGRFIVFHRDHGNPGTWGHPFFTGNESEGELTNGNLLPVVFSINCATGKFDDRHVNFAEQLLNNEGGGAVGVIGDSRDSPTWTNNNLALGLFDAIFPNVVPTYGSSTPIKRMGDVLNAGKMYMNTQNGLDFQRNDETVAEHYLYHWFGDPTMQIWTSNPNSFRLNELSLRFNDLGLLIATLNQPEAEGAMITLNQGGEVIGRAQLLDHQATIIPEISLNGEPLQISIDKNSFVPIQVDVGTQD